MLLFLEINPRVSGGVTFSNYREIDNMSLPYIDILVLKYILIVLKEKVENKDVSDIKKIIPNKYSLPKKVTNPQFNFIIRPLLIVITVLVLFWLSNKITIFNYDNIKGRK